MDLPPEQRSHYRWEGPEVIYTFWLTWSMSGQRVRSSEPRFPTPVIAEKNLSGRFYRTYLPQMHRKISCRAWETRMAPGVERVIIEEDVPFTELNQAFAKLLNDYDKGTVDDTFERCLKLNELVTAEQGLNCPGCEHFREKDRRFAGTSQRIFKKNPQSERNHPLKFQKKKIQMYLLIHPKWMQALPVLIVRMN